MEFVRRHKKLSIIVLLVLVFTLTFGFTFAKYVYNIIDNYILETKDFYFNSNVMSINTKSHSINNWDGVNSYTLLVDVNNIKNDARYTQSDITYNISFVCPATVTCVASKANGTIYQETKTDSFQVTMTPNQPFSEGENVDVRVVATSNFPYTKSLSAVYHIGVLKSNFSYNIEDSPNSKYLVISLTNSIAYYEVEQAFGTYSVGDIISLEDYTSLSDADKAKCYSAKITLTFDPEVLALDMTSNSYLHKISEVTEVLDDHYNYVNSFTFKLDATSTQKIIFYKYDTSQDYTYPIVTSTPVITVSGVFAE